MLPFSSCAYACVCFYIRRTHTHACVHTYTRTFAQSPFRHLFSYLQGPELMEDLTACTLREVLIWRAALEAQECLPMSYQDQEY